jgi:hypothetical protein
MLINLSNHPVSNWSSEQLKSASKYGDIIDIPFPMIDPSGDEEYIAKLVEDYIGKIEQYPNKDDIIIHLMGEMTFTFAIVVRLQDLGYKCIASTTKRDVNEITSLKKEVSFGFVRFRKYQIIK